MKYRKWDRNNSYFIYEDFEDGTWEEKLVRYDEGWRETLSLKDRNGREIFDGDLVWGNLEMPEKCEVYGFVFGHPQRSE
jgi:hypothetical protein